MIRDKKDAAHVVGNDAAAVPLLEYGVEEKDHKAIEHGAPKENGEVPELLVTGTVIFNGGFHLRDDNIDDGLVDIAARRVIPGNDVPGFITLSSHDVVTRRLGAKGEHAQADECGKYHVEVQR